MYGKQAQRQTRLQQEADPHVLEECARPTSPRLARSLALRVSVSLFLSLSLAPAPRHVVFAQATPATSANRDHP